MICCAERSRRAGGALAPAAAVAVLAIGAGAPAGASTPPPPLATPVAEAIAREWGVAPSALRLEWGRIDTTGLSPASPFRLTGRGVGGWFVVVWDPDGIRRAARVRAACVETLRTATRALRAGAVLAADDLDQTARARFGPPLEGGHAAPGWRVRRPVAAGELLIPPTVEPPAGVLAGRAVTLEWAEGPVRLDARGIAVHAARVGEQVRVRRARGERALVGVVIAPGRVALKAGGDR
jgi:flagella basal body P-ring formation protein FlgA